MASCTCPGPALPPSPNASNGKIRSPARTWPGGTATPSLTCVYVSLPSCTPAWRHAHCVNPEQSKRLGPLAPHTYGQPSLLRAALAAPWPGSAGTLPGALQFTSAACRVRPPLTPARPASPDRPDKADTPDPPP